MNAKNVFLKNKLIMTIIAIDDIKSLIYYDGCKNICHRKPLTMTVLYKRRIFYDGCKNNSHRMFCLNIL